MHTMRRACQVQVPARPMPNPHISRSPRVCGVARPSPLYSARRLWSNSALRILPPTRLPDMPASSARSARRLRVQAFALAVGPRAMVLLLTAAAVAVATVAALALWWLLGDAGVWPLLAVAGLCAVTLTPLLAWPLLHWVADLEAKCAHLDVLATRDELTGVHNRRQFLVLADREWARCRRYDMAAVMLMIDVDHFKQVNDRHGHLAGDLMLRAIARAIGDTLRHPDLLGRFGGEEFVVFLPHADPLGALDAAERIRDCVAALSLEWRGQVVRSTVSVGVATLDNSHDALAGLIHDADLALYAAKEAGRNCVRTLLPPAWQRGVTTPIASR